MDVHVPSTPARLRVTPTMVDDFLCDPVLGAYILFRVTLDAFQCSALRTLWWVPDVIHTSGFGTGKTFIDWLFVNLRLCIIGDQWAWIYYQSFESGKQIFWPYYERFNSRTAPLFAAQLGKMDEEGNADGKDNKKGPGSYTQHFKNGGKVVMPAPGWFSSGKSQAGLTFNIALVDEWTKIETMKPTENRDMVGGIDQQVVGRTRRACYNQFHRLWCNRRVYSATAESPQHAAFKRVRTFQREIAKGNPDFAIIRYDFKDFSNRPSHTGKPFKEEIPNWQVILNHKRMFTRAHSLREDHGIWARETAGWYSEAALQRCVTAGIAAGTEVETFRGTRPDTERVMYFLGGDPAPAETRRADDGALACLRARPKPGLGAEPTSNPGDWLAEFVWAYRVRGVHALKRPDREGMFIAETTRHWSGLIHGKHRQFNFQGILLDPNGAGAFIYPELKQTKQLLFGTETEVTPICTLEDISTGIAHFILNLFRRRDAGVQQLWPILQGDDNLIDGAHMQLQQAVEHALVLFPKSFNERPREETIGWPVEKQWALKNLDAARQQMINIQVVTKDDGSWAMTGNNAKQFMAAGKKDLAYACLFAYVRFLIWLKMGELEFSGGGAGEQGFYIMKP
jgi:hypothetical protein